MTEFLEANPDGSPFFCDWYQCSIDASEDNIIEALSPLMGLTDIRPCKGVPQYERSVELWSSRYSERAMFVLSYGGNQGASPLLICKGYMAREGMGIVRHCFPDHRVSRFDVAVDLVGEGLYERISEIMMDVHRHQGITTKTINHDVPDMGRTHYLGSRVSRGFCRFYEKGKQEQSQGLPYLPYHVRLESEIKPRGSADKAKWSKVSLKDAWGVCPWLRFLANRVLSLKPEAIVREPPMKRTDEDRVLDILRQYQRSFHKIGRERMHHLVDVLFDEGSAGLDLAVKEAAVAA